MQANEHIKLVIENLCQRQLGAGIRNLENYLLTSQQGYMEQLSAIKYSYESMVHYWQKGVVDDQRSEVYEQLLHRLYALAADIQTNSLFRTNFYWQTVYQRPRKGDTEWPMTFIRSQLENYVADMAVLELEPEHIRNTRRKELDADHQQFVRDLFDYILTDYSWRENIAQFYEELLLSPTIDTNDQQLIVSAITMSLLRMYDNQKFLTLIHVYRQSKDVALRQRALVGWVFAYDNCISLLYPKVYHEIVEVCSDVHCSQELTELQLQLYYCMDAESDQQKIRDEIMPDLMNGSRMKLTNRGLVEMDEDSLEDILHPEAAEHDMEKMEQSMKRMADMQRQGSDIYYAGFSQMKRFPFFNDLSNWFMPFNPHHPAVCEIWNHTKAKKFLQGITHIGAFCDSDKYSFVLAFEQVLAHMPESMLKMVEEGEAVPMPIGGEVATEEQNSAAFIRRMYLQNLFRFFRLYSVRREFHNPFADIEKYLFFAKAPFTSDEMSTRRYEVVSFLIKRQRYNDANDVLESNVNYDYQYCMLSAHVSQFIFEERKWSLEHSLYSVALNVKPGDRKAMAGLARALYAQEEYGEALELYQKLLEGKPDSKNYMLNTAICMVNIRETEKALKLLYKLNYLYPDDNNVNIALAWALTIEARYDDALKLYEPLVAQEQPIADAFLNYGYCLWFMGRIDEAAKSFRRFLSIEDNAREKLEKAFLKSDYDVLSMHQITDSEIQMMLDVATA